MSRARAIAAVVVAAFAAVAVAVAVAEAEAEAEAVAAAAPRADTLPQTVYFPSADGRTELVGYLFAPAGEGAHPAVVLLHGRAGPYSSLVSAGCTAVTRGSASPCGATSLSMRHRAWAEYWLAQGYAALLVDSFGPRGRAHGFGRGTHGDPDRDAVNELSVRPLDAEGALAWLVRQPGVQPDRVMLQGWSNGGSTVLNTLYRQAEAPAKRPRFRAALAFYPGCGPQALLARRVLRVDVPLLLLLGAEDEEVSPVRCQALAAHTPEAVQVQLYAGATHDFDDPGRARQALAANRLARADALRRAARFFAAAP